MSSVRIKLFASTAILAMTMGAASAADMAAPVIYQPLPVKEFGGWYLRGDIGMSNQQLKNLDYFRFPQAPGFTWLDERDRSIPTVVAGDFNAVDDHHTMQALYADGFRSAAHLAGAGFVRTWPADRRFPPA